MSLNADNEEYFRFTGPIRLDKELHTLGGLLNGIAIDGESGPDEIAAVRRWMLQHSQFRNRHPFNEIFNSLDAALSDDVLEREEIEDVLWLCEMLTKENRYFDFATSDMQRLQGIMGGILADGVVTKEELEGLREWMAGHEHLRRCWPYDELESVIVAVLADGRIDEEEQRMLQTFFAQFVKTWDRKIIDVPDEWSECTVNGVCAVCPEVEFSDRLFCFTGRSLRSTRKGFQSLIQERGGRFTKSLIGDTDFLIIGAEGNDCWAFACYGRKVERAIELRQSGSQLLLVHENDFWDAVEDG